MKVTVWAVCGPKGQRVRVTTFEVLVARDYLAGLISHLRQGEGHNVVLGFLQRAMHDTDDNLATIIAVGRSKNRENGRETLEVQQFEERKS